MKKTIKNMALVVTSLLIGIMIYSCTKENNPKKETSTAIEKTMTNYDVFIAPEVLSGVYVGHLRDLDNNVILTYTTVVDNGEVVASYIDDFELYPDRDTTAFKTLDGQKTFSYQTDALTEYVNLSAHYPCVQMVRQESPSLNGPETRITYTIFYGELDKNNKCWYE